MLAAGELKMTPAAPLTSLIGREVELSELTHRLRRARLLTLTGPGGVGKTRLALALADQLEETFTDGALFVDLAPISQPHDVPSAIARVLGLRDDAELPLMQRLANALAHRELLLILDNFEHLLPAGPSVVELLQSSSGLTVLATSRAALRVRGENEFPVPPLACPDPSSASLHTLLTYPALELFVRRAQDVRPDFDLVDANAVAVAEICRRLDGLPLALELAAARIRVLPPAAMLRRLDDGLGLLSGGHRDLPARQQTIRATIAWSYQLLNSTEQAVLRHLSVFSGDFSLEAALAVAHSAGANLDLLASLVEKNLIKQIDAAEGEARFRLLETVREFGREELTARQELESAQRAYALFFVALVEAAEPHLNGPGRHAWIDRLDREMDNLRSVVAWSARGVDRGEALVCIVRGLGFLYWRIRGHLHEGLRWCELALEVPAGQPPAPDRATILWQASGLTAYMGRLHVARGWLLEAVALARAGEAHRDLGYALVLQGFVESNLNDSAAADHLHAGLRILREYAPLVDVVVALDMAIVPFAMAGQQAAADAAFADSLWGARAIGDDWAAAVALSSAAFMEITQQRYTEASTHMRQAHAIFTRLGDEGSVAMIENNLGVVARESGDNAAAAEHFSRAVDMHRRLGLNADITLCHLGDLALRHADTAAARQYLSAALLDSTRGGEKRAIALSLCRIARLANAVSDPHRAARLLGAAEALMAESRSTITTDLRRELDAAENTSRAHVDQSGYQTAYASGGAAPLEQVTEDALAWLESFSAEAHVPAPTATRALSNREVEVLRLIAAGMSNRDIASTMVISLNTVARHVSNIFDKIGAANRTEAAAYAHRQHLAC